MTYRWRSRKMAARPDEARFVHFLFLQSVQLATSFVSMFCQHGAVMLVEKTSVVLTKELSYCRGWPTVREQLKRLCLHRRCVEYLATGNFYLLA